MMEQRPTQVEISTSMVKNKLRLSILCLEAEEHLAVALKEMVALVVVPRLGIALVPMVFMLGCLAVLTVAARTRTVTWRSVTLMMSASVPWALVVALVTQAVGSACGLTPLDDGMKIALAAFVEEPGKLMPLLVVALVTMPLLVTSLRDAVTNVDPDLLEMARLFRFGLWGTVRRVIIPAVVPPVLSAVTVAVGQSIRLTVMAELLSTTTGLGAEVQQARTNLETADVFALSAVMAALTLGLELLFLRPLRNRLARYR